VTILPWPQNKLTLSLTEVAEAYRTLNHPLCVHYGTNSCHALQLPVQACGDVQLTLQDVAYKQANEIPRDGRAYKKLRVVARFTRERSRDLRALSSAERT
jgi:hypothetical protein